MKSSDTFKQKCQIWGVFFLISLSCHFFCTIFSPILLHQLEADQMMFYMAGKAWMNGMVPYVDFIDVKGPLLWLLYAAGYLIAPDKAWGVYLVLTISTTVTLWYTYRTGRTLGLTSGMAILASTLTLFALFNIDSKGGRAEDLLHPFVAALIYYYTGYLSNQEKSDNNKAIRSVAWAAGLCTAAAFLTKFNNMAIGAMAAGIIFILEWKGGNLKKYLIEFAPRFVGGSLILLLPFAIVLSVMGALNACIHEYLFVNAESSNYLLPSSSRIIYHIIVNHLQKSGGLYLLVIASFFIPHLFPEKNNDFSKRLSLLFFCLPAIIINSMFPAGYYLFVCAPFFLFVTIPLVKRMQSLNLSKIYCIIPGIILTAISYNGVWIKNCPGKTHQPIPQGTLALENELQTVVSPRVIYFSYLDYGFGMKARALPGCPYWAKLNGLLQRCDKNQREAIAKRIPDFVICATCSAPTKEASDFLKCHGYRFVDSYYVGKKLHAYLYKRTSRKEMAPNNE